MIAKWMVSNFKSIREETELDFGPLTLFAGANSSGKSTFIQSILLVAQTLAHKDIKRPIILNGAHSSLGEFSELKSKGNDLDRITIKFTCHPLHQKTFRQPRFQNIDCEISFGPESTSSPHDLSQIQPRLFFTELFCRVMEMENENQNASIRIHYSKKNLLKNEDIDNTKDFDKQWCETLCFPFELDEFTMKELIESYHSKPMPKGCELQHFLPSMLVYDVDSIEEDANETTRVLQHGPFFPSMRLNLRRLVRRDIILPEEVTATLCEVFDTTNKLNQTFKDKYKTELLFGPDSKALNLSNLKRRLLNLPREDKQRVRQTMQNCEDLFERIHKAMKESIANKSTPNREYVTGEPPQIIRDASRHVENFFVENVKYLGPLRDAPKPLFPLAPAADLDDVGLRGEHTASVLELNKNAQIRYIQSSNFNNHEIEDTKVTKTLHEAVVDWLQYMEVASSVKSQDKGKLGHELKVGVSNSDSAHDLTHVGVGVSQVLPILVMCLLADENSTLIFEQPELHLHPKVQTLLGDFFISMALCSKQCIVETHSEYLIDRIRFRVAAASLEKPLNNLTKIYFVEKLSQSSTFREVVINEYGSISNWPEGFFDQSQQQAEKILRSAMIKRKAKRKG